MKETKTSLRQFQNGKMKKKIVSIILSVSLLCSLPIQALAGGTELQQAEISAAKTAAAAAQVRSSLGEAVNISAGTQYSGVLTENTKINSYRLTLADSGNIRLKSTAYMEWIYVTIFDEDGEQIWRSNPKWNETSSQISLDENFDLTAGAYYICFERDGDRTGDYLFRVDCISANETFSERNHGTDNLITDANPIYFGTDYRGQIARNDDKDFYQFKMNDSGKLNLTGTACMEWIYITVFDADGKQIWRSNPKWNETSRQIPLDENLDLTSGTYWICFERDGSCTGNYNFNLGYTSAGESFKETGDGQNNSIQAADEIALGKTYSGQTALNDDKDFYRFSVSAPGKVQVRMTSYADLELFLYDEDGEQIDYWYGSADSGKGRWDCSRIIRLEKAGRYYLCAKKDGENGGNYSFAVSPFTVKITVNSSFKKTESSSPFDLNAKVSDSSERLTYSSGNKRVATVDEWGRVYIQGPGTAVITVRAAGTNIKKSVKITVAPRKASLAAVTAGKGTLRVSWHRNTKATGYQAKIASNSGFTKNTKSFTAASNKTVSRTFTKLKRNTTYYVKVRAYKTVGTEKIYGSYSTVKKIRTR